MSPGFRVTVSMSSLSSTESISCIRIVIPAFARILPHLTHVDVPRCGTPEDGFGALFWIVDLI